MLHSNSIDQNCKLIIAGDGSEKEKLIQLIEESSYKNNITYLGSIREEEKFSLFKNADYNIVPTLELEGFGLVIIEAGICGCMSIVTNVDAMPEVISYLSNQGIIYDLNNQSIFDVFCGIKNNNYNREDLQQITKSKFFFD